MIGKRQYALLQTDFFLTKNLQGKFKILNNSVFGSEGLWTCRSTFYRRTWTWTIYCCANTKIIYSHTSFVFSPDGGDSRREGGVRQVRQSGNHWQAIILIEGGGGRVYYPLFIPTLLPPVGGGLVGCITLKCNTRFPIMFCLPPPLRKFSQRPCNFIRFIRIDLYTNN